MPSHALSYDMISLAIDEWDNHTMRSVAENHFAHHPTCQFVLVREHAGWELGWRRDGSLWHSAATGSSGQTFPTLLRRIINRNYSLAA